jgi:hypothetical protein
MESASSPNNDKPSDGLFPELKKRNGDTASSRPSAPGSLIGSAPVSRPPSMPPIGKLVPPPSGRMVAPPPSGRLVPPPSGKMVSSTPSAPPLPSTPSRVPPPPSSKLPPPPSLRSAPLPKQAEDISDEVEDAEDSALDASKAPFAEVEEELQTSPGASQKPIQAKEYVEDEGATIVRSSPLQTPPVSANAASSPPPRTQSSPSFGKLPPLPTPPPTSSPIPSAPRSIRVAPAAALVASVPSASAPHYSPPSAPPAPYVAPPTSKQEVTQVRRFGANSSIPPMVAQEPVPASLPEPPPQPQKKSGGGLAIMAVLGLAAAAAAGIVGVKYGQQLGLGGSATGKIVVTAAGANNAPLSSLRVLVDGTVRCEASPCTVPELSTGTHFVTVEAPGFVTTAARAVSVEKGGDTALHFDLESKGGDKVAAKTEAAPEPAKADAPPAAVAEKPAEATKSSEPTKASVGVGSTKVADNKKAADAKKDDKAPKSATGEGTLNINSIPVANVVLDGRPMGSTPLVGIKVSAGPHSVIFVHPELGRKAAGATVTAGKTSTVAVRF